MIDLWIIAAGRGTRMGDITIPKTLIEINGKSNLQNTLDLVKDKFRKVFVVVAEDMEEAVLLTLRSWYPLCSDLNVEIIPIESGGGDGKAVLEAYRKVIRVLTVTERAVILWGDAHLRSGSIVDELLSMMSKNKDMTLLIPVVMEKTPYVTINTNSDMFALSADFTKYGEVHIDGWHDQSIFGVNLVSIIGALEWQELTSKKQDKYGIIKFTTQSGELTFLNLVHFLWNIEEPARVYETKFPSMGYNTPEELEKIKLAIKS